jgi:hypothetical protein
LFSAVAAPLLAGVLAEAWNGWMARVRRNSIPGILHQVAARLQPGLSRWSIWAALPLAVIATLEKPLYWPTGFPEQKFPVRIAETHQELLTGKRIFTEDQWADYLIYRFYPHQRVFFDGRSDFFGPEIGGQYLRLAWARHDWRELLETNRIELVLAPPNWALATVLKEDRSWRVVADDGLAILFERKAGAEEPRAAGGER